MTDPSTALPLLLGLPEDTPASLARLDVLDWGSTLVFAGQIGDHAFELRYTDCRELRWRVYVQDRAGTTPLVGFVPGRDQHRSPAQVLTAHFGLSVYYGNVEYSSRIVTDIEC